MLLWAQKLRHANDTRLPITLPILIQLVQALPFTLSSQYYVKLLQAMFVIAFFGFFRIGELTSPGKGHPSISHSQLTFVSKRGGSTEMKLTLSNFKHNKNGKPHSIFFSGQENKVICPISKMQAYIQCRGGHTGPLFCTPDLKPVPRQFFTKHLNNALTFCNLNPNWYKSHSFRIGSASYAAEKGMSDAQIRQLGRWKTEAFKRYIRPTQTISL